MKRSILVPHDFTDVGNFAMEHAFMIGKASKNPIHLIHIVKHDSEIEPAKTKLQNIADEFSKDKEIDISITIKKGSIFKEIYKYGVEIDAYLAVMGTHGIKNIKKAMKIVRNFEKIPFILVQSPVIFGEYSKIVSPIDTDKSSRIKMQWVKYLNTLFESKVYIVSHSEKDKYKIKNLATNLSFASKWLDKELIDYEFVNFETKKDFADKMYSFADSIGADIILIMAHKYKSYIKDLKKVESIELYKKIPIMCVNKRTDIHKIGGFN